MAATIGTGLGMLPQDAAWSRLVVVWGANPAVTNAHGWPFVLEAKTKGARVVVIDPLRSRTAEESSPWPHRTASLVSAASVVMSYPLMTPARASRPCVMAFWATTALPSGVRGPVDFWAFKRLAWICATLAMLIPPSILAVILATLIEVSVGAMLIGGILPGLVLASLYALYIVLRSWIQPEIAPPYDLPSIPLARKIKDTVIFVLPLGFIIFLVVGIIFLGVATPSEAAAMGAVGSILLSSFYGQMNRQVLTKCLYGTIKLTTTMFVIIMASTMFSQILAFSGASSGLVKAVVDLNLSPILVLISMQVSLLFLGCFMDNLSIAVIAVPIFMPVLKALGFDPLWVGVMTLINMDMGNLTPPFGLQLFVMKGMQPSTPMSEIIRSSFPFLLCETATLILVMIFPQIAIYLPSLMRS